MKQSREAARIQAFCAARGLSLEAAQIQQLCAYTEQLERWNQRINLVSCRDRHELLERHVLDALSVAPYLQAEQVLDAGSGAGLPGIPLAIALPSVQFHLVDSITKKAAFLRSVCSELQLGNVMIHNCRLHALAGTLQVDCLVSRAFGPLHNLLQESQAVLSNGATLLLMKGRSLDGERGQIQPPFREVATHDLSAADTPGQSVLLQLVMDGPQ